MDSQAIIESYVGEVVRHLPRNQRHDVGIELRSLLTEELDGRAADAGRAADPVLTMELLTSFGRPQEVAQRYRPAGFTVIRPADAPRFARWAFTGVLVQWMFTLPASLVSPAPVEAWVDGGDSGWGRLAVWWLSWGLGAFWWPGVLITFALIAAALGRREREAKAWTPSRTVDRDRVNPVGTVLALSFWVAGATILIALPWLPELAPGLPQPLLDAFALDQQFLLLRAPWVLPLWAAHFALYVALLLTGRWSQKTRLIDLALSVPWLVLLIWWLTSGDIFQAPATDESAKLGLMIIVVLIVVDTAVALHRISTSTRIPTPQTP